jgi:hypothetical protein
MMRRRCECCLIPAVSNGARAGNSYEGSCLHVAMCRWSAKPVRETSWEERDEPISLSWVVIVPLASTPRLQTCRSTVAVVLAAQSAATAPFRSWYSRTGCAPLSSLSSKNKQTTWRTELPKPESKPAKLVNSDGNQDGLTTSICYGEPRYRTSRRGSVDCSCSSLVGAFFG